MREAKPWFRKFDGWWYVEVGGKQTKLAKGKDNRSEAIKQFHLLMAGLQPAKPKSLSVAELCDVYLRHSEREHTPETFAWHKIYLQSFVNRHGLSKAVDVIPFHVTAWLNAHPKWKGARRHALAIVKRAFSYSKKEGLLAADPLADVALPRSGRRERTLTAEERHQILGAIRDQAFRDFIFALQETGCRPGEVAKVTAENVNLELGVWIFRKHKTAKKTGKPRVVYLTPAMVELSRKLMLKHPEGPMFRGPRQKMPFTRNGIRCRFRRLREKLPHLAGVVAYSYRHTYCTEALVNGVGIAQVAELMGHSSTEMVMTVYSKLSQHVGHLRDAAMQATGA